MIKIVCYNYDGDCMKKRRKKPDKKDIINYILIVILLGCFVVIGKIHYPKDENNKVIEPVKISSLGDDNVFIKSSANEVYKKMLSGEGIIFLGLSNSKNSDYYAKAVDEVAKSLDIKDIMYYDVSTDRKNSNGTYGLITEYLINYLEKDDSGNPILHTPSLLIIKDNNIIFYDSLERLRANITEEDYWTDYNYNLKKAYIEAGLNSYLNDENETLSKNN